MTDTLLVLHPGVEQVQGSAASAASPASAASGLATAAHANSGRALRIALLDNTKVNAIELLNAIAQRLEAHGNVIARSWRKRHAGESGANVIPDILQWQPDVVLTGLGD